MHGKRNAFKILIIPPPRKEYFRDLFTNETRILKWMIKKEVVARTELDDIRVSV
jgi:hypothetical protein